MYSEKKGIEKIKMNKICLTFEPVIMPSRGKYGVLLDEGDANEINLVPCLQGS